MSTTIIHHLVAVFKMPSKWGDRILRATTIQGKLTGNTTFPVASWPANIVTLTQLGIDITAFVNAENAVKTKTGNTADRNTTFNTVKKDLENIMGMVQVKADANPATAASIITNAGYFVKTTKLKQKQINDALNTQVSGTVLLTADAGGHHEWQMSKDMVTIISLPATSTAHTLIPNLNPGDVWWFRNKKVNTAKTTYNWSPWVKLQVSAGGKLGGGGANPGHAGSLPTASNL